MDPVLTTVAALAALLVVVLLGALVTVTARRRAGRRHRELADELAASRAAVAELRDQVQALSAAVGHEPAGTALARPEFVITSLADDPPPATTTEVHVDAGRFAAVAVGESVVRVVSLAHGVRRALSADNRNRIRFEVRREVKRARRQRRRDLKEAKRQLRSHMGDAA